MNGIVAYYYLLKKKPENFKPAYLDIHVTFNIKDKNLLCDNEFIKKFRYFYR